MPESNQLDLSDASFNESKEKQLINSKYNSLTDKMLYKEILIDFISNWGNYMKIGLTEIKIFKKNLQEFKLKS